MIVGEAVVTRFKGLIRTAEAKTIARLRDGRSETEPSATDRFLADLERTFEEEGDSGKLVFRARSLRDRGRNAPENKFGADFCGVLNVKTRGFGQTKGFLAQAKIEGASARVTTRFYGLIGVSFPNQHELERLKQQASDMLRVTPDSFVFIYSLDGFAVVPASSVVGFSGEGGLYGKRVADFFGEYIMCFIGDPRIRAYDDKTLEDVMKTMDTRTGILFSVKDQS
jgi:hypothetical protein